jgi:hypothetical protein
MSFNYSVLKNLFKRKKVNTSINDLIPGEIINDEFYESIYNLALDDQIKNILEIGSSSGGGSTNALVEGIKARHDLNEVKLFCLEVSKERHYKLQETYKNESFFTSYRHSSINVSEFPSKQEIRFFYDNFKSPLNNYKFETIIEWYEQDLNYLKQQNLLESGIDIIKNVHQIQNFDFVLIDGSEFTGERDLAHTIGAKFIALDDIKTFKCYSAFNTLVSDDRYQLVVKNLDLRNGFAIFKQNNIA